MQLLKALAITYAAVLVCNGCAGQQKPKFADVAELLCEGLEDFDQLHNDILSIHLLIEQGNYADALKVAYAIIESIDETKDIEGMKELRALVFLLESIVRRV
ncbi:MAG TPA: hypothetical protein VN843_10325 [Anaerolineales bacterium]|nr:hypothetical protein [Anaerolineales bacterium]